MNLLPENNGSIYNRIESFLNGNIIENRRKLAKVPHRNLTQGYKDLTGCTFVKAHAFADYIKGEITFQAYCDANHQPPSRTL